jgi:hypothetical protein
MEMTHQAVESSNIQSIGYDEATLTLEVLFLNGGRYQYKGVLPEHHDALMQAESIGKHLHAQIKGKYECVKVEPKPESETKTETGTGTEPDRAP